MEVSGTAVDCMQTLLLRGKAGGRATASCRISYTQFAAHAGISAGGDASLSMDFSSIRKVLIQFDSFHTEQIKLSKRLELPFSFEKWVCNSSPPELQIYINIISGWSQQFPGEKDSAKLSSLLCDFRWCCYLLDKAPAIISGQISRGWRSAARGR